jgi:phosphate uptake regulator
MSTEASQVELELLERELGARGRMVRRMLCSATESFRAGDVAMGQVVVGLERDLRSSSVLIAAAASRLLTANWQRPADARRAIAARRVNDELDRIGELGMAIARLVRPVAPGAPIPAPVPELDELTLAVAGSLRAAMDAFSLANASQASMLADADVIVGEAIRAAISAIAARTPPQASAEWGLRAMIVVRCLRRISEHSLRIAAHTGYVATGLEPVVGAEGACGAS